MSGSGHDLTTVLIANPGADVYGSDLQMLESVSAMMEQGWRVVVAIPRLGPLVSLLKKRGADVLPMPFPVVRRENLSPAGSLRLARDTVRALRPIRAALAQVCPDVVYVNTVTIPCWLAAARLSRRPTICHVHEAENSDNRLVLRALYAPLLLASTLVVNSRAAAEAMTGAVGRLAARTELIYNGVPEPAIPPTPRANHSGPFRLAIVCRLSPRKAPDVALEALACLRREGRDVHLEVCGTAFDGYEWYADKLHARASEPDLAGRVTFSGYQNPVWPALARCDAVIAPSLREPFGNAVVEAQLALRPVVASAALGHLETVSDGRTGLLVPVGDARALGGAVARLMDDPDLAARLARQGRQGALDHFSIARYNSEITALVRSVADRPEQPGPKTLQPKSSLDCYIRN